MSFSHSRRLLSEASEEAVRLARVVSLAARIEPELLRRARLELLPDLDVSAEADFWFGNFHETRSTRWLVLRPELADILRDELTLDRGLLDRAWDVLRRVHVNASPMIILEEEVTYLALSSGGSTGEAIERKLASVAQAIVTQSRAGLLDWALRAIPHLPQRARESQGALVLNLIASGAFPKVGVPRIPIDSALTALVARSLTTTDIWLRLVDQTRRRYRLDISRRQIDASVAIQVPKTEPVVVEVISPNQTDLVTIGAERMEFVQMPLGSENGLTLRTAAGNVYRIQLDWSGKANTAVLVVGPAVDLSPWLAEIARELGQMLAREGYKLITAGGTGVEEIVAESFLAAAGDTAKARLRHVVGPRRQAAVKFGRVVQTRSDQEWVRTAMIDANAVVVLEGGPRTKMVAKKALESGVPVVPVGATGAAASLREEATRDWLSLGMWMFSILHYSEGEVGAQIHAISELLGLRDRTRWNLIDDEPPAR